MRSRYVKVNVGVLTSEGRTNRKANSGPEVKLNLFSDVAYTGVVERFEQTSPTSSTWTGTLKGEEFGYFYLVISDGAFIAHVASPTGIYEVSSVGDDVYQVIQIDQSALTEVEDAVEPPASYLASIAPNEVLPTGGGGSSIDVMIVYTSAARIAEGSVAAMNARVDLAIAETNASYVNSGVATQLKSCLQRRSQLRRNREHGFGSQSHYCQWRWIHG